MPLSFEGFAKPSSNPFAVFLGQGTCKAEAMDSSNWVGLRMCRV